MKVMIREPKGLEVEEMEVNENGCMHLRGQSEK